MVKTSIDTYYKKTGFERHKVFFSGLFTLLLLIGVFISYAAVQQQRVYESEAAFSACTGEKKPVCDTRPKCQWHSCGGGGKGVCANKTVSKEKACKIEDSSPPDEDGGEPPAPGGGGSFDPANCPNSLPEQPFQPPTNTPGQIFIGMGQCADGYWSESQIRAKLQEIGVTLTPCATAGGVSQSLIITYTPGGVPICGNWWGANDCQKAQAAKFFSTCDTYPHGMWGTNGIEWGYGNIGAEASMLSCEGMYAAINQCLNRETGEVYGNKGCYYKEKSDADPTWGFLPFPQSPSGEPIETFTELQQVYGCSILGQTNAVGGGVPQSSPNSLIPQRLSTQDILKEIRTGGGKGPSGLIQPSPTKASSKTIQEPLASQNNEEVTELSENSVDISGDGVVDSQDLAEVRNIIASPIAARKDPENLSIADLNSDGIVDSQDYSLIIASIGLKLK